MNCPSCSNELSRVTFEKVELDLCRSGCGGIWFDQGELAKFEDPSINVSPSLLRVMRNAEVVIDRSKARSCPSCTGQVLQNKIDAKTLGVEVDTCLQCSGIWLDLGELDSIRSDKAKIAEMEKVLSAQSELSKLGIIPRGLRAVMKLLFQ
jgi:Zn-finger nucleic acid-binding protein